LIIWSSLTGCVMCLTGLVWGVFRYSPSARYRLKREQSQHAVRRPDALASLRGPHRRLASFTWVFSGLLSMDPVAWVPGTVPTRQQRDAVAGGKLRVDAITIDRVRAATWRP